MTNKIEKEEIKKHIFYAEYAKQRNEQKSDKKRVFENCIISNSGEETAKKLNSHHKINLYNIEKFVDIEFQCDLDFEFLEFAKQVTFKNCIFDENVFFDSTIFNKGVIFDNVHFKKGISLNSSIFTSKEKAELLFVDCTFGASPVRNNSDIEYAFDNAKFLYNFKIEYRNCIFNSVLSFKGCELSRALYFNFCTFNKTPNFSGTDFSNGIDFFECSFKKKYNTQDAGLFYREMKILMKNSGNNSLAHRFHSLDQNNIRGLKIKDIEKTKVYYSNSQHQTIIEKIKHVGIKGVIGFFIRKGKRFGNFFTVNSLYHFFSDYGYSFWRPFGGLFIFISLYLVYNLFSGVSTIGKFASPGWQKELCLPASDWKALISSFLLIVKPIIAPIYKLKFIEPISGFGVIFYVLWFIFFILMFGFFVTAVRKRYKF